MRRALATTLLALAVAGCAGKPAPPDRFLRLDPPAPAALAAPVLDGTLLVKRIAAEGVLAQRPVLHTRAGAPETLLQYNYHFWAEPPPVMLQALAVDALRAAGAARQVVTPQYGADARFVLVGRLRRLEHRQGDAPAAIVAMELGIEARDSRQPLLVGTYEVAVPADGPGVDAAAAAMSRAVGEILARFVSDLAAR